MGLKPNAWFYSTTISPYNHIAIYWAQKPSPKIRNKNNLFYTRKWIKIHIRNKQQANLIRLPKINQFANKYEYKRNASVLSNLFLLFVTFSLVVLLLLPFIGVYLLPTIKLHFSLPLDKNERPSSLQKREKEYTWNDWARQRNNIKV